MSWLWGQRVHRFWRIRIFGTCCHCSVAQSCPTLCDPMDCSMPGFPVLHHLPEFAQTHGIQSSHSLIPFCSCLQFFSSISVFSNELTLHIRWPSVGVSASVSVLPMSIQGLFPLRLTGLISLQSKGLPNTTVQKHQYFGSQPSSQSNSHIHT